MSGWKEASCGIFSCTVSIGYFNGNHWKRPSMNVHDEEICNVPVKDIVEKIMAKRHHLALQHQIEACLFDDLQDYGRHQLGCHAMFSDLFWRCGRFTRASWYPAKFVGNGNASIHLFFSTWPTAAHPSEKFVCIVIAKFTIIFTDDSSRSPKNSMTEESPYRQRASSAVGYFAPRGKTSVYSISSIIGMQFIAWGPDPPNCVIGCHIRSSSHH